MRKGGTFRDMYMPLEERATVQLWNDEARHSTGSGLEINAEVHSGGQTIVKTGWESIERPVGGDIVPVSEGKDSAFRAFVDASRASGVTADLDTANDVARRNGWNGESVANMRDLGHLCEHFKMGLTLEHELTGCLRYSMPSKKAQIRLVYLENRQFGWVRDKTDKVKEDGKHKAVRFQDNS